MENAGEGRGHVKKVKTHETHIHLGKGPLHPLKEN